MVHASGPHPWTPKRISKTTAKSVWKLTNDELSALPKAGASKAFYTEADVRAVAKRKALDALGTEAFEALESDDVRVWQRAVRVHNRRRKLAHGTSGDEANAGPSATGAAPTGTASDLPPEILRVIMQKLVLSARPTGLESVQRVARHICNAAAVCKAFREAAAAGFECLEQLTCDELRVEQQEAWGRLVRDPTSLKVKEMQELAQRRKLKKSGRKHQLARRLLDWLGVKAAPGAGVPPALVLAIKQKRLAEPVPQPKPPRQPAPQYDYLDDMESYDESYDDGYSYESGYGGNSYDSGSEESWNDLKCDYIETQAAARYGKRNNLKCKCGNSAAVECEFGLCYHCCSDKTRSNWRLICYRHADRKYRF